MPQIRGHDREFRIRVLACFVKAGQRASGPRVAEIVESWFTPISRDQTHLSGQDAKCPVKGPMSATPLPDADEERRLRVLVNARPDT